MATSIQHYTRTGFEPVGLALRNVAARYHAWAENRRRIARISAELHAYTDRQLLDLGLCRSDIPEVARGTFRRS
jgi:uncharacterized protein YjiS (DUF1127 family)